MRRIALLLAFVAAAGCSSVLGFKDPSLEDGPADAPPDSSATCTGCPFGCEAGTTTCRDGKLWLFLTSGAVIGNAFGGTDNPVNVRGGADGLCRATFTNAPAPRPCAQNNIHAIIHVNAADGLAQLSANYGIPTTVPVHRFDDDILVANNWNDLLDTTIQPRAPVSTAATVDDGAVWTGANAATTCTNWTSAVSTVEGVRGHTTVTATNWLNREAFRCDRVARLLCVCWPGMN